MLVLRALVRTPCPACPVSASLTWLAPINPLRPVHVAALLDGLGEVPDLASRHQYMNLIVTTILAGDTPALKPDMSAATIHRAARLAVDSNVFSWLLQVRLL